MSPARMYSLAAPIAALYSSDAHRPLCRRLVQSRHAARPPWAGRPHRRPDVRSRLPARPAGHRPPRRRGVRPRRGRLRRRGRPEDGHHHVVDQDDALAPVVERAELADDDERGVGMAQVVGRHAREALDLAHHVVAEIPDQPPVQRRQPGQRRRLEARHQRLHRRQDPVVGALQAQPPGGLDPPGRAPSGWPAGGARRRSSGPSARRPRPTRKGTRPPPPRRWRSRRPA